MTLVVCLVVASSGVLVVTDVPVSASSTGVVLSEDLVQDSDWEVVGTAVESVEPLVWRIRRT